MAEDDTAFPTLDDVELSVLDGLGTRRAIAAGDHLYRAGDTTYDFYVVLSGAVDIILDTDGDEQVVATHGPGKFLGELNMVTGTRVLLSARVAEPGEVIAIPPEALRHLIATQARLGDTILAAFMARRSVMMTGAAAS